MNKRIRSITLFFIALLMGVVVILPSFRVNAGIINPVLELNSSAGLDELCTNVNSISQEVACFDFITQGTTTSGKTKITLDMITYSSDALTSSERQDIMETALTTINDSNSISGQSKTRLYNFIANQDTATASLVRQLSNDVNADFATAYSWFKPFTGTISTLLGISALVIFTALAFMIIVDLSYLTIPLVRYWLTKDDGKARFVSNEAKIAIEEAEKDSSSGKTYLGVYLKRKSVQLAILSICLLYLVGGKIYVLIGYIIDSFQGFLG